MFSGFVYLPGKPIQRLESLEGLETMIKEPQAQIWIDMERPTEEDLRKLDEIIDVDDTSLEACLLNEDLRPRVDEFADHIFLLLYGVLAPDVDPTFAPRQLAAFCGERYLFTIHRDKHRTIEDLKDRFESHGMHKISRGVDFLLYTIIDGMVDNYAVALDQFERRLDELEEESLESVSESVFSEAVRLRREVLELRRLALSQREAIAPLARGECDYIAPSLGRRFNHVSGHLTRVVELSDSLREVLVAVRENYQSAIASRTNEIMRTLTIVSTILLPMSLIAGIYGMNLPIWPSPDHPASFFWVIAIMGGIGLVMGLFFRSRRWM